MIAHLLALLLAAGSIRVGQIRTCAALLSALQRETAPTISDLHTCFGEDDDGELDAFALIVCHTKCDAVIDSACGFAFDERLQYPDITPSILLTAAKDFLRSHGYLTGTSWIEWPGRPAADEMLHVRLKTAKGTIVFEFLEDRTTLETIYLPDGRNVFSAALPACPARVHKTVKSKPTETR